MSTMNPLLATLPPDYQHSLANLAARLHQTGACPPLEHPLLDELELAETIILLLIDGMGMAQLGKLCPGGFLARQPNVPLRSVFPSTTTAAITTLMTGLPPSQHSLLSWHLWSPELAAIATPLPMRLHWPKAPERDSHELGRQLYSQTSALKNQHRAQYVMQPWRISASAYSQHHGGEAMHLPWRNHEELFANLQALSSKPGKKYIYAYIPDLDSVMHEHGSTSHKARQLLHMLDRRVSQLSHELGKDAILLVSADHGQMDVPVERFLFLNDFPEISELLLRPLSGEPRAAFCHVQPGQQAAFASKVMQQLGHAVDCIPASQALQQNWFGPGPHHPLLSDRVGDFILLAKEDWAVLQMVDEEPRPALRGNHGGFSKAEMEIPLLVIRP